MEFSTIQVWTRVIAHFYEEHYISSTTGRQKVLRNVKGKTDYHESPCTPQITPITPIRVVHTFIFSSVLQMLYTYLNHCWSADWSLDCEYEKKTEGSLINRVFINPKITTTCLQCRLLLHYRHTIVGFIFQNNIKIKFGGDPFRDRILISWRLLYCRDQLAAIGK